MTAFLILIIILIIYHITTHPSAMPKQEEMIPRSMWKTNPKLELELRCKWIHEIDKYLKSRNDIDLNFAEDLWNKFGGDGEYSMVGWAFGTNPERDQELREDFELIKLKYEQVKKNIQAKLYEGENADPYIREHYLKAGSPTEDSALYFHSTHSGLGTGYHRSTMQLEDLRQGDEYYFGDKYLMADEDSFKNFELNKRSSDFAYLFSKYLFCDAVKVEGELTRYNYIMASGVATHIYGSIIDQLVDNDLKKLKLTTASPGNDTFERESRWLKEMLKYPNAYGVTEPWLRDLVGLWELDDPNPPSSIASETPDKQNN